MNLFLLILSFKCCMFYVCKSCTLFFLFLSHGRMMLSHGRMMVSDDLLSVTQTLLCHFAVAGGFLVSFIGSLHTYGHRLTATGCFWYLSDGHMILSGIFFPFGHMIHSGIFCYGGFMILSGIFCYGGFMILSGLFIMVTCYCTFWNLLYYSFGHSLRFN